MHEEETIELLVEPLSEALILARLETMLHEVDLWLQITDLLRQSQRDRRRANALV